MTAALRALMTGVIDYAGLFPPAKLPLEEAVEEFLAIQKSPESWMLRSFVLPASRLDELVPWTREFNNCATPPRFAIIGDTGADLPRWRTNLDTVLTTVSEFCCRFETEVGDCSLELPITGQVHCDEKLGRTISETLQSIASKTPSTTHPITTVDLEVSPASDDHMIRSSLIRECGRCRQNTASHIGFKLRTGGLKSEAFPTVEQLTSVIRDCQVHECCWKATAGLHHPIRHTDAKLGVKVHGFLNVLFAAVLADAHDLPEPALCEILADEDTASFQVTADGILWRDLSATVEQIVNTRQTTFQSFGSCSFDEPRDDLKELGLL